MAQRIKFDPPPAPPAPVRLHLPDAARETPLTPVGLAVSPEIAIQRTQANVEGSIIVFHTWQKHRFSAAWKAGAALRWCGDTRDWPIKPNSARARCFNRLKPDWMTARTIEESE